jgi:hypothetical protein
LIFKDASHNGRFRIQANLLYLRCRVHPVRPHTVGIHARKRRRPTHQKAGQQRGRHGRIQIILVAILGRISVRRPQRRRSKSGIDRLLAFGREQRELAALHIGQRLRNRHRNRNRSKESLAFIFVFKRALGGNEAIHSLPRAEKYCEELPYHRLHIRHRGRCTYGIFACL